MTNFIKDDEYVIIKIVGKKKEIENVEKKLNNTRKFGNFSLEIPIKQEGFRFNQEPPKIEKKDGIFIFYFSIEE